MDACVNELSSELRPPLTANEVVDGRNRPSSWPRHAPVEEWLGLQQRFAHLLRPGSEGLVRQIQDQVDAEWDALCARCDDAPA